MRRQIFGLGSLQVVIAAALLTVVGMAFGFAWQVSFVGAAGFVLTSTAIVMSVLYDPEQAGNFSNKAMMDEARRQDARVKEVVQAMLNGEKDWDELV